MYLPIFNTTCEEKAQRNLKTRWSLLFIIYIDMSRMDIMTANTFHIMHNLTSTKHINI